MWYVRDVLYAVLYVRISCFVVRGCSVSRRYIDVYGMILLVVSVLGPTSPATPGFSQCYLYTSPGVR